MTAPDAYRTSSPPTHEPLHFEQICTDGFVLAHAISRAKVPGGWIVMALYTQGMSGGSSSMTFIPDPQYEWQTRVVT